MADTLFKSGFVALVGRPNVGKSTLLNSCMGKKFAPESPIAQTTRKRLRAIITRENSQIIIVDTPGIHKPKDTLGSELNKSALAELADADIVCFLIDATMPVGRGDAWIAKHVEASSAVFKLLVITKADIASSPQVSSQIEEATKLCSVDDVLVVSAAEGFNVDAFLDLLESKLPEGPKWYLDDMNSDADDEELISEFIREKLCLNLKQELPHAVAVVCYSLEYVKGGHASIEARILVEREGQKGIVLGSHGSMIKRVGMQARKDIEHLLGCKVFLKLSVEVSKDWRKDIREIKHLGYMIED